MAPLEVTCINRSDPLEAPIASCEIECPVHVNPLKIDDLLLKPLMPLGAGRSATGVTRRPTSQTRVNIKDPIRWLELSF